jgi:DNA-binding MarR family transcriptional regulator
MKLLEKHSIHPSRDACAAEVMDTALWIVRLVRAEIRRTRPGDLSLTQVRALGVLEGHPDCTLSAVAEVLGLTAPSTSHLVDGLVRHRLIERRASAEDRRQVCLRLTARGERALDQAFDVTRKALATRLAPLTAEDRDLVARAMKALRPLVTPERHPGAGTA